ncbi:hypothetical protein GGR50DRAFT_606128 [Xylaria sp. CBS 124048]|nr:hypothetical protein GGR50DRAFT_606128 [Xylaria sp. CBS 124048]
MPQPSRLLSRTAFRPTGLTLPRGNGPTCHFDATTLLPEASRSQSSSFFHTSRPRCFTISPIRIRNPSSRAPPTVSTNTSTNVSTAATPRYPNAAILPNISDGFWRVIRSYKFHLILFFGSLGLLAGTKYSLDAGPRSPPLLGSAEDLRLKSKIQAEGNALPIVKQLSADPAWNSWDAYAGISTTPSPTNPQGKSAAQSRITSGPMSGSTGLAFQRVFHNASTGELVNVVYFGPSLASWPGYVHGGALATVLDETLGRCAILKFPSRTGVTANLEMQYRAPTRTGGFYVIRARPMVDETRTKDGAKVSDRKLWVRATLESVAGKLTVEAKALFVVPKGYTLRPVEGL